MEISTAAVITLLIAWPLSLLLAFMGGAWLNHRADRRMSPIPDVPAFVRSMIDVMRPKPKQPKNSVPMPRMRA
jgi:hypothetical protein